MLSRIHALLFGVQVVDYDVLTTQGTFVRGQLLLSTWTSDSHVVLHHIARAVRAQGHSLQAGGRHGWHTTRRPGLLAMARQLLGEVQAVRA